MSQDYQNSTDNDYQFHSQMLSQDFFSGGGLGNDNSSSMIDESDLLDLGPLPTSQRVSFPTSHISSTAPVGGRFGFSNNGLGRTSARESSYIPYGTTPPIPEEASPFETYMAPKTGVTGVTGVNIGVSGSRGPWGGGGGGLYAQKDMDRFDMNESSKGDSPMTVGSADQSIMSPLRSGSVRGSLSQSVDEAKLLILEERRRKRRESHNAVERRRRDNINDRIKILSDLLPEKFLAAGMDPKEDKPNKATILSRGVDYIRELQMIIDEQNQREIELQGMVQALEVELSREPTVFNGTVAELALAKAGIRDSPDAGYSNQDEGQNEEDNTNHTEEKVYIKREEEELNPSNESFDPSSFYKHLKENEFTIDTP